MNEYLGAVYVLIGIASLALAAMIPTRANDLPAGLMLCALLTFNALERFSAGYNRLVGLTESDPRPAARVLVWAIGSLIVLTVLILYAWRTPERISQLDRMERAALKDQEGGRKHRKEKNPGD